MFSVSPEHAPAVASSLTDQAVQILQIGTVTDTARLTLDVNGQRLCDETNADLTYLYEHAIPSQMHA